MKTFLQVADQYYVLATSVLTDRETRVLKHGETFAVFDAFGDVQPVTHAESGLFHRGTRHVSRWTFTIFDGHRPLLLNSTLRDDNGVLKVDMTNPDYGAPGGGFLPKGTLHFHREKFILDAHCFERVVVSNFGTEDTEVPAAFHFQADFADIFEVRGMERQARGRLESARHTEKSLILGYEGLDRVQRRSELQVFAPDVKFENDNVSFVLRIPAGEKAVFATTVCFSPDDECFGDHKYESSLERVSLDHLDEKKDYCKIRTSNERFDSWVRRSTDDLIMMTTKTDDGFLYPYAGIPWYCVPFGRDAIITALECLWVNPRLAEGVLGFLAKTQAREHVIEQDSTPGKIIHEVRQGEMAQLKEVPFGMYYGSVDSTPLFVCLGGSYLKRTGNLSLIDQLWPSFEAALSWLEKYGDLDGDGFLEYARENPKGLIQQGWKDSHDSVFHADGRDAKGPIALCEVQGYAYLAWVSGYQMARALGRLEQAERYLNHAEELKKHFNERFWLDDLGTYALALDGDKNPCRVPSSNAGQCLFTGIVEPERARILVKSLMSPESFSGWGIRTIPSGVKRYNPMSYHNGSVWPHDVALVAWGMSKYGFRDEVERVFQGLFRAATYMDLLRLPEVFCGFQRREGEAPTLYPHACSPQAWASGSVFLMLQALIGLEVDAIEKKVTFSYPQLPESIETLQVVGLEVGGSELDFRVQNYHSDVSVQILKRSPDVMVSVNK